MSANYPIQAEVLVNIPPHLVNNIKSLKGGIQAAFVVFRK
jgi:hypothetical protein